MKSILDDIIEGNAITRQTGNTLTQDVSKPLSTSGVSTLVTELEQELYDKIDYEATELQVIHHLHHSEVIMVM